MRSSPQISKTIFFLFCFFTFAFFIFVYIVVDLLLPLPHPPPPEPDWSHLWSTWVPFVFGFGRSWRTTKEKTTRPMRPNKTNTPITTTHNPTISLPVHPPSWQSPSDYRIMISVSQTSCFQNLLFSKFVVLKTCCPQNLLSSKLVVLKICCPQNVLSSKLAVFKSQP